jgi:2-polyprenyl-3-methyl-5-hydroxy-6-metoxy-1,4-benzoquinol methylase
LTELIWEEIVCNWCGTPEGTFLLEGPDRHLHLPGQFRLVVCPECGLIRQNPRLVWSSLKQYYPESFCSFAPAVEAEPSLWRRLDRRYGMWKWLRAVERYQPGGRLLDVGCGTGIFLAEAQRTGRWQVTGVEPSQAAADYARLVLKLPVLNGALAEVESDLPSASFDVVTLWNVLEHLPEPITDLRRIHRLLRPGGWLIAMIPNVESLAARVFGPYWLGWELPRHLYLFPRQTLQHILISLGLKPIRWQCFSSSYFTLAHSLEFWSETWSGKYPLLARLLMRLYRTLLTRAVLLAPLWVLDQLKRSTIITVFAQKQE